jgi:hypothetical protein
MRWSKSGDRFPFRDLFSRSTSGGVGALSQCVIEISQLWGEDPIGILQCYVIFRHESIDCFVYSSSVVRWGRVLLGRPRYWRRRGWFNSGDMPYRLLHGRIPPLENVTEYRASVSCKGPRDWNLNLIMKTLSTSEATFENARLEINQTLNGSQTAKLGDRAVGRPFLAAYHRPVQSSPSSVGGYEESDFMKSQLG